jgi:hypothetical protein
MLLHQQLYVANEACRITKHSINASSCNIREAGDIIVIFAVQCDLSASCMVLQNIL